MRIFLVFLALHIPSAYAIKDLLSLCERNLMVDDATSLNLAANQIALSGPLDMYWEQGMEGNVGYIIADEFVRRHISPRGPEVVHWINEGDQIFILDEAGKVKISGYFRERYEMKMVRMDKVTFPMRMNVPYLFKDETMTEPVTKQTELRGYFSRKFQAVVIKTLSDSHIQEFVQRFSPWFNRYEINKTQVERFARVGRRRAHELSHFQEPVHGVASVTSKLQPSKMIDIATGEVKPGGDLKVHQYVIANNDSKLALSEGDYLYLLDSSGVVTYEGNLGSEKFPMYSDDLKMMDEIAEKIRNSSSAFVARIKLPKSD